MSSHSSDPAGEWAGYSHCFDDVCVTDMKVKDPLERLPVMGGCMWRRKWQRCFVGLLSIRAELCQVGLDVPWL